MTPPPDTDIDAGVGTDAGAGAAVDAESGLTDGDAGSSDTVALPSDLDRKINQYFAGAVVRKDLVKAVKGNAIVPTYVLEYLLGQYAASDDEATIRSGIESVRDILAEHYVHRNEAGLVRSKISRRGRLRVIDKVSVSFNEKTRVHEATFTNLVISGLLVDEDTVKRNERLLVAGVWCLCDVEYFDSEDQRVVPWILGSLKPIQLSSFDFDEFVEKRAEFTTDEWVDLLIQSIGFDPEMFGRRAKLLQLVRLVPFVERNYNLVELGPKGTGKSHIYSEFSPHGMLISGGEITKAKLFVANTKRGEIGLVGYWDVVAFDEFAGRKKRPDKALVDIMKNYMANKSFSRGVDTVSAEASMVFVGNTSHTVPHMLKHSDLFDELPDAYHDPAYLDRLHHYIPGWEVDTIRGEMFSNGYGFVVDYIAEVLKSLRSADFSDRYQEHFTLSTEISTRDRDGVHKTFSGLMKLIYPDGKATSAEIEELLQLAIEGRKRVKDQIVRMDSTMAGGKFGYSDSGGTWHAVTTLEEDEYPRYYHQGGSGALDGSDAGEDFAADAVEGGTDRAAVAQEGATASDAVGPDAGSPPAGSRRSAEPELLEGHRDFQENQRGVSYATLLMPYLHGASEITIVDPYIQVPHQGRNLADLLALLADAKDPADEIAVTLVTKEGPKEYEQQHLLMLNDMRESAAAFGITFTVAFDDKIHDRSIRADNGWKILLGRGLDIFLKGSGSPYDLGSRHQAFRQVAAFGVTYIREDVERGRET